MCESHVSGCQLLASPLVNAQRTPAQVRPARTCALPVTYTSSSKVVKSCPATRAYARIVATASATPVATPRARSDDEADMLEGLAGLESLRELELDRLDLAGRLAHAPGAELAQPRDHLAHQRLRRGRARGYADARRRREPVRSDLAGVVDEVARDALARAELREAVAVRAVLAADDDQHVDAVFREPAHGVLAVLRRIADVAQVRSLDPPGPPDERVHHFAPVVHPERR